MKRITPACAGKRQAFTNQNLLKGDHPRMCGEKKPSLLLLFMIVGSPPHVRGKGPTGQRPLLDTRITPACAGKRQAFTNQNLLKGDHPRMCGEKKPSLLLLFMIVGSPPHVRGKECPCVRRVPLPRITPACAGKRSYECGTVQCGRDHPRVCGEKQYQYKRILSQLRITPACAGKRHSARKLTSKE